VKFGDAGFRRAHAALAFDVERLGDDADGEDAEVACDLGDHRGSAVPVPPPMPAVTNTILTPEI